MRGIYLNITKQFKLEIIRKSSNNIDKINTSAQALGWSKRHAYRKLKDCIDIGAKSFIFKNIGK